jgi:hypothetical protein
MTRTSLPPKLNDIENAQHIKSYPPIIDTNVDVSQLTSTSAKETPTSLDEDKAIDNVVPSNNKHNSIQSTRDSQNLMYFPVK